MAVNLYQWQGHKSSSGQKAQINFPLPTLESLHFLWLLPYWECPPFLHTHPCLLQPQGTCLSVTLWHSKTHGTCLCSISIVFTFPSSQSHLSRIHIQPSSLCMYLGTISWYLYLGFLLQRMGIILLPALRYCEVSLSHSHQELGYLSILPLFLENMRFPFSICFLLSSQTKR